MSAEKHQQKIDLYLLNGGLQKHAIAYRSPSLQNRAKISHFLMELSKKKGFIAKLPEVSESVKEVIKPSVEMPKPQSEKPKFLGIIAQYPAELHPVYQNAYNNWIKACSLKIKLNAVDDDDEEEALEIQTEIFKIMERFDKDQAALNYYTENKRVLPTATATNFDDLSPIELMTKRNSLRGLVTRRTQTLNKRSAELPAKEDPTFRTKQNFIHNKTEELQDMILQLQKLDEMLKVLE